MNDIAIGIVSDLHAEFWQPKYFDTVGAKIQAQLAGADLILMAGDIDHGPESISTARRLFPDTPVCLVAGNHEFYGAQHDLVIPLMRDAAKGTNVSFLHRQKYIATIKGTSIRVLGVTLWTDFALFNTPDLSVLDARRGLNDFRLIRYDATGRLVTPADTLEWHHDDRKWLLEELKQPFQGLTIVLSHHAPVSFAIASKYVGDKLSPCFASRMEDELARDDVALVVWGHTHHSVDRTIDRTRFVSNQTGYVGSNKNGTHVETNEYGTIVTI